MNFRIIKNNSYNPNYKPNSPIVKFNLKSREEDIDNDNIKTILQKERLQKERLQKERLQKERLQKEKEEKEEKEKREKLNKNYYYLFHKYLLNIEKETNCINYKIIQNNITLEFKEKKYYAHLYCYDISRFNKIYGDYINKISEYFSVIITYVIGENTINNSNFVIIKISNKGMNIGGNFCAVDFLNKRNIEYHYILFLHSNPNEKFRIKYFNPLIDNLDNEFIKNINNNDGYFPNIIWEIVGDKVKMISGNPELKELYLEEKNLLYRKELLKYLDANNKTTQFIEGNCYILSKKVVDKLYTDPLLYNILNTESSFDYNWICKVYNIQGDIYEVYKKFTERKLAPRNEKSYDAYYENVFERISLNFCNNYKILNNNNSIYLIGITNKNVSISENIVLLKNYLTQLNSKINVNIYNITELNKINYNAKTIFCIQPFEMKYVVPYLSKFVYKPEVLWVWEFKSLPEIFKKCENYFSKIYVPSQFCYNVFSKHLSIPIEKIELKSMIHDYLDKIQNHIINNKNVNDIIEKTKNKTIYGYCFDLNSSIIRKNPLNLVKAFNNLNDNSKVLILKYRLPRINKFINEIEKETYYSFIIEVKKNNNIYCITDELEVLDLYKLYTYFDYYISPHCGEGYGLTIYDNMILGNKIISPYYSGETDYLNRKEIIELEYEEIEINGLKYHPNYGQMSEFKAAYISVESIFNCLNNVIGDEIYILGNGPSLKNCDFNFLKHKTTFALNSSYKKFAELDFYPTYFGCFDPKLIECHYNKFVQLMNDNNKIKKFFFLNENNKGQKQFSSQDENNSRYQKINFLPPQESYINKSSFNKFYKMHNSGATAALISILLGYKNIILLGCDGNYVEQIPETRLIDISTKTLQILETPEKNPNYWFDNYQEKGEIYSLPDGKSCNMKGWELLYQASKIHNIEIINENTESKIPYFVKFQKNIIIMCNNNKDAMGISTVYNQIKNEIKLKKILNINTIYKLLYLEISDIKNFVDLNVNKNDKNIKLYIIYPNQFNIRVNLDKNYNQSHYLIIHDFFPLEISEIYCKRNNNNILEYNTINVNNFINILLTFDAHIILYPSYKMYNLPFKKQIYVKINHLIKYKNISKSYKNYIVYPAQCQFRKNIKSLNDTLNYYNLSTKIFITGNDIIPDYDKKKLIELQSKQNKNLQFLNYLNKDDYNNIISNANGFIYPSIAEGGCLVIQELLMTYKPIAINNYKNLFLSLIELLELEISEKTKKQIFFTNKYKFEKDCEINKIIKSNFEGIYDKLFIIQEICNLYIPTIKIYNSDSLESTKEAIDWINNFELKEEDKIKLENIYYNFKEEIKIITNNQIEKYQINLQEMRNLNINFKYINNYSESIDIFKKEYGLFNIYNKFDFHKLKAIKNIFKNERIFIFGNGPSLNKMDLELFKNEYTFCTNKFCLIYDKISWRPTFYHFNDPIIIDDLHSICNGNLDKLESCVFIDSNFLLKFNYNVDHFVTNNILPQYYNPDIKFQENIENGTIGAGSVIGNTIQIASYLGFTEIYLVGCDCNYIIPKDVIKWGDKIKNSDYNNKYIISQSSDPNHFVSNYFGKGKHWHDPNVKRMISGHIQCLNGIKKQNKTIINAGIDSKCEVYEKKNYKEILKK